MREAAPFRMPRWSAVGVVALLGCATSCSRGKGDHDLTADIQRRTSALTEVARTGWVVTPSPAGTGAANAVDGDPATSWNSGVAQVPNQTVQVDLGSAQTFNEVILDAGSNTGMFPAAYKLEVSNDGATWGAGPVATGSGSSQAVSIRFVTTTARYLKITQTATKSVNWAIAELRVYNGTQPCDTCTGDACHVATCNPMVRTSYPPGGLMGLWHLDGDGRDSGDNANHFTSLYSVTPSHGVDGAGYAFAAGSYIWQDFRPNNYTAVNWTMDPGNMAGVSFTAWVNPNVTCPGTFPLYRHGTQVGVQLSCTGTGAPGLSAAVNTGSGLTFTSPAGSVPSGTWSFVAMTWDKSVMHLRVNGTEVATFNAAGNLIANNASTYIGSNGTSSFIGTLDEVSLYGRMLQPAELDGLVSGPVACQAPPKCTGDPCHDGVCDAQGNCSLSPTPKSNGTLCNDGQACTQGEFCTDGVCGGGQAVTCSTDPQQMPSSCHEETCDPAWKPIDQADIIGQWDFNNNSTDTSGHNLDMALAGAPPYVTGRSRQALHFGTSQYAIKYTTPTEGMNNPRGVTFAAWVNPDAGLCPSSTNRHVMVRWNEFGLGLRCYPNNTLGVSAEIQVAASNGGLSLYNPVGLVPTGQWTHVAVTYAPPYITMYVNGMAAGWAGPFSSSDIIRANNQLLIGYQATSMAIDEPIAIRRALSVTEIEALYRRPALCNPQPKTCADSNTCHANGTCNLTTGQCEYPNNQQNKPDGTLCSDNNPCTTGETCLAGQCGHGNAVNLSCAPNTDQCKQPGVCDASYVPTPTSDGLVGWWRFEGNTKDSSGHGIDLVNVNSRAKLVSGKAGSAYDFDGSACMELLHCPAQMDLSSAAGMTLMAWVKTSPNLPCPSGYRTIAGKGYDYSFETHCGTGGTLPGLAGMVRVSSTNWGYPGAYGAISKTAWTHVAVTWKPTEGVLHQYINGQFGGQLSIPGSLITRDPSFNIGCFTQVLHPEQIQNYMGSIDEVALYNRALDLSEITDYIAKANGNACKYDNKAEGAPCSDGDACTQSDSCNAGTCNGSNPVTCTAQDQCHTAGTCNPSTGACSNPPAAEGLACNDDNACTQTDTCHSGACTGANPVTCVAQDGCHAAGTCNPGTGACSNPSQPGGSCQVGDNGTWLYEPAAGMDCSQATGINNHGAIVGYSEPCGSPPWPATQAAVPFTLANGAVYPLPIPSGATSVFPSAVGSGGEVLANAYNAGAGNKNPAYLYPNSDINSPVAIPWVDLGAQVWALRDTNPESALSTVAGGSLVTAGDPSSLTWFSYDVPSEGAPGPIYRYEPDSPNLRHGGAVLGTNKRGDMVGYYTDETGARRAMVYTSEDGLRELHDVVDPGGDWVLNTAFAINDDRQIVGYGTYGTLKRAFLADLDVQRIRPMDPIYLADPNLEHHPVAVNSEWHVVGTIGVPSSGAGDPHVTPQRAFVYTTLTGTRDLNEMISMPAGWVLISATGINDGDEVSGVALNVNTLERRAFKGQIIGLPSATQIACEGKNEGEPCSHGRSCAANNVCHNDVCGGGDVEDAVCLTLDGVVDIGDGHWAAKFGYENHASGTVKPSLNQVEVNSVVVPDPVPAAPAFMFEGIHKAIFKSVFQSGSTIAWRVNGQRVSTLGVTPANPCADPGATVNTVCNDNNPCTTNDRCNQGQCVGQPAVCPAPPACHMAGTCNPTDGTCVYAIAPEGTECNDNNACTQTDRCQEGHCSGTDPVDCVTPQTCQQAVGVCQPATGTCVYPPKPVGAPCDDGDQCTGGESCQGGACIASTVTLACIQPVSYSQTISFPAFPDAPAGQNGVYGDINGDGKSDLVVLGGLGTPELPVGISDGDGGFTPTGHVGLPWGHMPGAKTVMGDFDGDGKADIMTLGGFYDTATKIAFSNGDGTFRVISQQNPILRNLAAGPAVKVLATDINSDGRTDLAFIGTKNTDEIAVAYSQDASGTFFVVHQILPEFARLASQPGVKPVTCGDSIFLVGGVGWTRIPHIRYSPQSHNGSLADMAHLTMPPPPSGASLVTGFHSYAHKPTTRAIAGDFDGNGFCDIALVGPSSTGTLPVALSSRPSPSDDTRIKWAFPVLEVDLSAYMREPGAVPVPGNFDGNRTLDIAIVGGTGRSSIVTASGHQPASSCPLCPPPPPFSFSVQEVESQMAGHAARPNVRAISNSDSNVGRAVPSLDSDGDRRADIILAGAVGSTTMPIGVSRGNGAFTLVRKPVEKFAANASNNGAFFLSGDFDADGLSDALLLNGVGGVHNASLFADSNGDGTFRVTNPSLGNFNYMEASQGRYWVSGDFNGDGYADVARLGGTWKGNVDESNMIFLTMPDGTSVPTGIDDHGVTYYLNHHTQAHLVAVDINGDGADDLVVIGEGGTNQHLIWALMMTHPLPPYATTDVELKNEPNPVLSGSTSFYSKVLAGDFNGDGLGDVAVVGGFDSGSILVGLSNGDGTFQNVNVKAEGFTTWARSYETANIAGDFNGDGLTDLAIVGGDGWTSIPVASMSDDGTDGSFVALNEASPEVAAAAAEQAAEPVTPSGQDEVRIILPPPADGQVIVKPPASPYVDMVHLTYDIGIWGVGATDSPNLQGFYSRRPISPNTMYIVGTEVLYLQICNDGDRLAEEVYPTLGHRHRVQQFSNGSTGPDVNWPFCGWDYGDGTKPLIYDPARGDLHPMNEALCDPGFFKVVGTQDRRVADIAPGACQGWQTNDQLLNYKEAPGFYTMSIGPDIQYSHDDADLAIEIYCQPDRSRSDICLYVGPVGSPW